MDHFNAGFRSGSGLSTSDVVKTTDNESFPSTGDAPGNSEVDADADLYLLAEATAAEENGFYADVCMGLGSDVRSSLRLDRGGFDSRSVLDAEDEYPHDAPSDSAADAGVDLYLLEKADEAEENAFHAGNVLDGVGASATGDGGLDDAANYKDDVATYEENAVDTYSDSLSDSPSFFNQDSCSRSWDSGSRSDSTSDFG